MACAAAPLVFRLKEGAVARVDATVIVAYVPPARAWSRTTDTLEEEEMCVYVCMCVLSVHVCLYVCVYVCMCACVCMCLCMYVCMYVFMYACMCVCIL